MHINVGYTDNGLVVLTITDPESGATLQVPMSALHAYTIGESLMKAASIVRNGTPALIVPPARKVLQ